MGRDPNVHEHGKLVTLIVFNLVYTEKGDVINLIACRDSVFILGFVGFGRSKS